MSGLDQSYRFSDQVRLIAEADGRTVRLETPRGPVRLRDLEPDHHRVLQRLLGDGASREELLAGISDDRAAEVGTWMHYTVDRLVAIGLVDQIIGRPAIAVIEVIGRGYRPNERSLPSEPIRLSRFAWSRQDSNRLVLESPRCLSRVVLQDWRAASVIAQLAAPVEVPDLRWPTGIEQDVAEALVRALFHEGFLEPARPNPAHIPSEAAALGEWEFHDLLFHSRSRQGRHANPYGGTYAHEGEREPLPAARPLPSGEQIPLDRADIARLRLGDIPFTEVIESRRSWRQPGPRPLRLTELGEFLHRAARIRGRRQTEHEEVSNRPYPGGGADYELEIYPVVHRVDGLAPGLYYYGPLDHVLVRLAPWEGAVASLAQEASSKAPPGGVPDVLFVVTARFGRLTYKYQSICYAIALKDLGVLYQTFYLVATAMGLAPCALGGGDSEAFAASTGLSPFVEPQIGEFMLNTRHPDEVAEAPPPPADH